jgi:hypothetical protein
VLQIKRENSYYSYIGKAINLLKYFGRKNGKNTLRGIKYVFYIHSIISQQPKLRKMSGEFIALTDAQRIIGRLKADANTHYVDIGNLQAYITESAADQIYIQKGINDNYTETLVITCYKGGSPVYHMDGGNQCVLEHISIPPPANSDSNK